MHSILDPHGPAARALASYGWAVLLVFLAVTLVLWALLVWVAVRRRGSLMEHAPVDAGGGISWILVGGIGLPAALFGGFFVAMLGHLTAFPLEHVDHAAPDIRIVGHRWWWEIEYRAGPLHDWVRTASDLHIPVGRTMDIELATADVIHSFWVPSLHGKVDLIPRMPTRIRIQADDAGIYRGQCAEFCGAQHSNMVLTVIAEPAADFERWLARERAGASAPATAEQQRGQALFNSRACVLCHTIRGTAAKARVGPDLTHLASRRTLAGVLPNNEGYLRAWITHAQSLKPGVVMPSIIDFSSQELHDLTAYLQHLR